MIAAAEEREGKATPMANESLYSGASSALRRSIRQHWGVFLAEGIILVLLGIAAIVLPPLGGLVATVTGLVSVFASREAPGFIWALLSSLAAIAAGVMLLWNPLAGLATLTYV